VNYVLSLNLHFLKKIFQSKQMITPNTLIKITTFALVFNFFLFGKTNGEDQASNILIITVDNLGYADLKSYNKNTLIKTPNLDHFATQSARLTSFYTASPTCTVSRACLMTGRIPQRHKLTKQLGGVKGNFGIGLRQSEILIPRVVKGSPFGYTTGAFGKWNIGFAPGSRPTERGFDEFLGHASGNIDYYHHVYNGKHDLFHNTEEIDREGEYSTDLFANSAIKFIETNSKLKKPWFVYLPFNSPHFPNKGNKAPGQPTEWQAPAWAFKEYGLSPKEQDPEKRYRAVVTALDRAIGRVFKSLDEQGVADNTFVFLYSDNGTFMLNRKGLDISTNAPLRSGGVTCWEGGLRVAAFARWPNRIKAHSVIDVPLWSPDLMVTSAKLSGAKLPKDLVLDGLNMLPVLEGKTKASPHKEFYFEYLKHAALRKGNWKIVRTGKNEAWQLYDLSHDISEKDNLAANNEEKVQELEMIFNDKQMSMKE
jgi:arylsulfatase A